MAAKKRKRSKKTNNTYLYVAIACLSMAVMLAIGFVMYITSDGGDVSNDESVSEPVSEEESTVINESSEVSAEESEVSQESSEIELSPTEAYEKYIGVEYAVDMTDYEQYVCPENEADFVFLVNPDHPLASDYVPEDLVWCTNIREGRPEQWSYMVETANKALEAFLAEAAFYGYDDISVTNAYRSYSSQASLFNNYVSSDMENDYYCDTCDMYIDTQYEGKKVVDGCCAECGSELRRPTKDEATQKVLTYSTRPGTSEHQSGLCCDMHNLPSTSSAFDNTPEAEWLAENAHRFGFILRYPEGTQHITGIKHESWHFRYVGRTAATEIYEAGITLDEYLA